VECLLIADDLTGACDAAVQFATKGFGAAVALELGAGVPKSDVLAVSTESRGLSMEESRRAIMDMALWLADTKPRILFKKIDSTLRGNAGAEIAATVSAFGCDAAVITPAFPAMKRIVADGWLRVAALVASPVDAPAEFEAVEIGAYFQAQGLASHRHVRAGGVTVAIGGGVRYVSVDAACDADLDAVVETMMGWKGRILWAGSAGLAAALARSISTGRERIARPADRGRPVLFCIGSTHPATLAQQRRLLAERPVCALSAEGAAPGEIADALCEGRNVMLEIPRGRVPERRMADLLQGVRDVAGALALSGGDTASHVCRALRAQGIELHAEIEAGIPWGTLRGGAFEGVAVATKSGAFGDSSALIGITDFFTCPKA
jgi:D-threonate/D-erythronate kinase